MIGSAGFCPSTVCQFWGGWISSPHGNRSGLPKRKRPPPPSAHLASVDLIATPGPKPRCLLQKHPTHSPLPTQNVDTNTSQELLGGWAPSGCKLLVFIIYNSYFSLPLEVFLLEPCPASNFLSKQLCFRKIAYVFRFGLFSYARFREFLLDQFE